MNADAMSNPAVESVSEVRVRYSETDQMGVVYHANYLAWCEIGRTDFLRGRGPSYAELEANGILLAVSDASLRYHRSAKYDDVIQVRTRLLEARSRVLTFEYAISRDEANGTTTKLVTARTSLIAIDREGRTRALPVDLLSTLRTFVTPAKEEAS
jgi:acyl-CoA thioester hydrolase